jgi:hypothetical protein
LLAIVQTPRRVAAILAAVQLGLCALAVAAAGLGAAAVLWSSACVVVAGIATIAILEARMERLAAEEREAPRAHALVAVTVE